MCINKCVQDLQALSESNGNAIKELKETILEELREERMLSDLMHLFLEEKGLAKEFFVGLEKVFNQAGTNQSHLRLLN